LFSCVIVVCTSFVLYEMTKRRKRSLRPPTTPLSDRGHHRPPQL
jgi:hypothetical protein